MRFLQFVATRIGLKNAAAIRAQEMPAGRVARYGRARHVWRSSESALLLFVTLLLASTSETAHAGINVWTSNGPEGGLVYALAIDPTTPSVLYANGNDTSRQSVAAEFTGSSVR